MQTSCRVQPQKRQGEACTAEGCRTPSPSVAAKSAGATERQREKLHPALSKATPAVNRNTHNPSSFNAFSLQAGLALEGRRRGSNTPRNSSSGPVKQSLNAPQTGQNAAISTMPKGKKCKATACQNKPLPYSLGQGKRTVGTAEPETCRQAQACPVVPPQCPQTQRNGKAGRLPTLNAEDACRGFWGAPRRSASPCPLRRGGMPFMAGEGHGHHWPKACPQKATEAPPERFEGRGGFLPLFRGAIAFQPLAGAVFVAAVFSGSGVAVFGVPAGAKLRSLNVFNQLSDSDNRLGRDII